MAINKEGNVYTIGFAFVLVVVVGTILSLLSVGLKPIQLKNQEIKKKIDILSAILSPEEMNKVTRKNAEEKFEKYIDLEKSVVLDYKGNIKEGIDPFQVDIRAEHRDKTLSIEDKNFPLFVGEKDGETVYVIPIVGKGLWGPIWGYISVGEDMKTIIGASFGHKGETPGLGAEITQPFFVKRWYGEKIVFPDGSPAKFEIVKDGSGKEPYKVDGITGGTITSVGVQEMVNRGIKPYVAYFKKIKK